MSSGGAQVKSIDALREFRAALVSFRETAGQSLSAVDVEIRRMLDWLKHDQLKYWQQEVRVREDLVNEARGELSRCLMSNSVGGQPAACTEQKVALAKARKRLEEARQKIETVRRWTQVVEQEVHDYRGPAQVMGGVLDSDIPRAMSLLDRKVRILEEYANMMISAPAGGGEGMAPVASGQTSAPAAAPAAPPPVVEP